MSTLLKLIEAGEMDTEFPITHAFPLIEIDEDYRILKNKLDKVINIANEF